MPSVAAFHACRCGSLLVRENASWHCPEASGPIQDAWIPKGERFHVTGIEVNLVPALDARDWLPSYVRQAPVDLKPMVIPSGYTQLKRGRHV